MKAAQLLEHFDRLSEAPGAVPRLRRFILDLAVRGKLVAREAGDEPAGELLKRIRAERLRVLMKTPVRSNVTSPTEFDSTGIELPAGWAWSKLGDLCTKTGSGSTPAGGKDAYIASGVPFLRSQNVYDDGLRLDGVAFISDATQERMSSTTVKAGDLLLNITGGSIGRCAIVPDTFVIGNINQHVAIIRLALLESGRFLHSVICSDYFQRHIFGNQTGAGREGLPKNRMDEILIPIPPLAEQHRIVAKVDELMALCDQLEAAQQDRERRRDRLAAASLQRLNQPAADTTPGAQRDHARFHLQNLPRLTTRPEHIKPMRQTILNCAVSGRLVSQNDLDEPAFDLFRRISHEKKRLLASRSTKEKLAISEDAKFDAFDLPRGWSWQQLDQLAWKITDGDHLTPQRESSGRYLLSARNVLNGRLDLSDVDYVGDAEFQRMRCRCDPDKFDVLISCSGSIGRVAIVDKDDAYVLVRSAARVKLVFAPELSPYIAKALMSDHLQAQMVVRSKAAAQPNLFIGSIRQLMIPIPPLPEQHRIVAKVDELMALCDQLEAQLTTTQTDSRRLLEAVLEAALTPA